MVFELGKAVIDVDIEKTAAFYKTAELLSECCTCKGCQNFVLGAEKLSSDIIDFFSKLGIDILKPAEIMTLYSEDEGKSVYYSGWYHLCGKLISDLDCWMSEPYNNDTILNKLNKNNIFLITNDFSVGFTNSISLKDKDFPKPVIQMEISIHHFPWVLDTPNTY